MNKAIHICLQLAFVVSCCHALVLPARAADNPVLRKLLSSLVQRELSRHHSEDTAFYNESEETHVEWAKLRNPVNGQVIGKTKIAEWKDKTETWVWLENPSELLSVEITRLDKPEFVEVSVPDGYTEKEIRVPRISGGFPPQIRYRTEIVKIPKYRTESRPNDRFSFGIRVSGKVKCKARGKVRVASADVKASARARIVIAGSFTLRDGKLADAEVSTLDATLHDIRPNNDIIRVLQGPLLNALGNHFLDKEEGKMKDKIVDAVNGQSL